MPTVPIRGGYNRQTRQGNKYKQLTATVFLHPHTHTGIYLFKMHSIADNMQSWQSVFVNNRIIIKSSAFKMWDIMDKVTP